jgi:hypothetical protein
MGLGYSKERIETFSYRNLDSVREVYENKKGFLINCLSRTAIIQFLEDYLEDGFDIEKEYDFIICKRGKNEIGKVEVVRKEDLEKVMKREDIKEKGRVYEGRYGEIFMRIWSIRDDLVKVKIKYDQDISKEDLEELRKILDEGGLVRKLQEKKA